MGEDPARHPEPQHRVDGLGGEGREPLRRRTDGDTVVEQPRGARRREPGRPRDLDGPTTGRHDRDVDAERRIVGREPVVEPAERGGEPRTVREREAMTEHEPAVGVDLPRRPPPEGRVELTEGHEARVHPEGVELPERRAVDPDLDEELTAAADVDPGLGRHVDPAAGEPDRGDREERRGAPSGHPQPPGPKVAAG